MDILTEIAGLANQQSELERRIAKSTQDLADLKKEHVQLSGKTIPALLESSGINRLTTKEGVDIKIEERVFASIPKETNPEEAYDFLRQNGASSIIKNNIEILFDLGDEELSNKFESLLRQGFEGRELNYTRKKCVHHKTLLKEVKNLLKQGVDFKDSHMTVYTEKQTKIS